jgi:hypothetical protein
MGAAENGAANSTAVLLSLAIYCLVVTCAALNLNSDAGGMWHRAQAGAIRSVPSEYSESLHGSRSHSSCCWIFLRWSIGELEY